jgi:hypothetical protein
MMQLLISTLEKSIRVIQSHQTPRIFIPGLNGGRSLGVVPEGNCPTSSGFNFATNFLKASASMEVNTNTVSESGQLRSSTKSSISTRDFAPFLDSLAMLPL